ncbi:MAG: PD-(D/E)XK nuclease family protein [Candidatus Eremiobacteraeota bacterium]|nr:PD-(D/E)XK nuclease family protein [Candidatus Eremiobacteraeota bacterium]MBV8365483.1 PD-(D/E)XK nuclease family protein [Candidatus Eremiobacteraeota bacterium]
MSDIKNEFAYSWSRADAFYQCPRRFYWQHYGSWNGWEDDAPANARLAYRLKHIQSLAMLIGEIFHAVVGRALRERPERPSSVPAAALHDSAERIFYEQLAASRAKSWRTNPKYNANLFEDYYSGGLTARESQEGLVALHKCIDGFAADGFGRRAFGVERARLKMIDDPANFDQKRALIEGVIVYAPPDLVVEGKDGTSLHIVDWKTGRHRDASVVQLAVYGLVVSELRGVPISRLSAHLVYVGHGQHDECAQLSSGIEEAKRKIDAFVHDVQERLTDVERNVAGDIERFPMTTSVFKCRSCKFRELCGRTGDPPLAPDEDLAS